MAMQSGFIKRIRDIMRMDAGINGDAQRIEQMVWMLFLKVYDAKEDDWELNEDNYESIIPEELRWRNWAKADSNGHAMTGDKLLNFVNNILFPVLKGNNVKDGDVVLYEGIKVTPDTPIKKAIVKSTFEDANNYMKDGVYLRQVIDVIDEIEFDDVNKGDTPELEIYIRNTGTKTLRPNIMHLPPYLSAAVTPENLRPGHAGRVSVSLNSEKLHDYGLTQTSVYLAGNPGEEVSQEKEITVSAVLLPGFDGMTGEARRSAPRMAMSADSLVFDFEGKSRKKGEIKITNNGRTALKIRSLQMFTGGLRVTLGKRELDPGESTTLKVTAYRDELLKAHSRPRILMITNDPDRAKVVVKIKTK